MTVSVPRPSPSGTSWSTVNNGDSRDEVLYYSGNGSGNDARPGPVPTVWYSYQDESTLLGDPVPINDIFDRTTALATADIDGDGDLDVVHASVDVSDFAPRDAKVAWIENLDGRGAFGRRKIIYTELRDDRMFQRLWVADIDGDGDADIVATKSREPEPVWFENLDGQGNFGGEQRVEGVPENATLLVHDLDSDGRAELLAVNRGRLDAYAYEAPGASWTFTLSVLPWPHGSQGLLLAGDLDGDGDQDLALSTDVEVSWFQRRDSGSFASGQSLTSELGPRPSIDPKLVALADFDGDQDLDIVYSVWRDPRRPLTWLENQGRGRFISATHDVVSGMRSSEYAVADLDGDGDFDIVTYAPNAQGGLRWLENRPVGDANGDGRFDSEDLIQVLAAGKYEDDVPRNAGFSEGDWDGDGEFTTADLVAAFAAGHYMVGDPPA